MAINQRSMRDRDSGYVAIPVERGPLQEGGRLGPVKAVRVDHQDVYGFSSWVIYLSDRAVYSPGGILSPHRGRKRIEFEHVMSWRRAVGTGITERKLRRQLEVTVVEAGLTTHGIMRPL